MKEAIVFYLLTLAWVTLAVPLKPMTNRTFIEDDILIPDTDKGAVKYDFQKWPGGVVIYDFHSNYPASYKETVVKGMKFIEERTCIKFTKWTTEPQYVEIVDGMQCATGVGYFDDKSVQMKLILGSGCMHLGTVIHELLHVIGFLHEHQRSDRDDYLIIHWENVEKGEEHNFNIMDSEFYRLLTPFDYDSIMLYGSKTFGKNGLNVMLKKNGDILKSVSDKGAMSESDVKRVNMLYNCPN